MEVPYENVLKKSCPSFNHVNHGSGNGVHVQNMEEFIMNKVKLVLLTIISVTFVIVSCTTQRFTLAESKVPTIPTYEGKNHFIFWGLGQTKSIDSEEICGERLVMAVETHCSFLDGFLGAITYGIYSPQTFRIYCKKQTKGEQQ
jgi:hypothetical protein